jgi:hypothetical protein
MIVEGIGLVICLARISCIIDDRAKEWLFYHALELQGNWIRSGKVGKKPTESSIVNDLILGMALKE